MSTSYLLDSSVLVASFRQDPAIQQKLSQAQATYIPSIALGELYLGAYNSAARMQESLTQVDELAGAIAILSCDANTAKLYGRIKRELRAKGQMIPDNDLWIAATALQCGLTLAARDEHFNWLIGLSVEQW